MYEWAVVGRVGFSSLLSCRVIIEAAALLILLPGTEGKENSMMLGGSISGSA